MKISNYNFNGINLKDLDAKIRTIQINYISGEAFFEIDIAHNGYPAIARENIRFNVEDMSILEPLIDIFMKNFDVETGKQIVPNIQE